MYVTVTAHTKNGGRIGLSDNNVAARHPVARVSETIHAVIVEQGGVSGRALCFGVHRCCLSCSGERQTINAGSRSSVILAKNSRSKILALSTTTRVSRNGSPHVGGDLHMQLGLRVIRSDCHITIFL